MNDSSMEHKTTIYRKRFLTRYAKDITLCNICIIKNLLLSFSITFVTIKHARVLNEMFEFTGGGMGDRLHTTYKNTFNETEIKCRTYITNKL